MLKSLNWESQNRSGIGKENDASEFLRVLVEKVATDMKDVMQ